MVSIGPILSRELRSLARRPRAFRRRCSFSIALVLLLGLQYLVAHVTNPRQFSPRAMAWFAESVFLGVVFLQISLAVWLVPGYVAVVIAEEKDRRTLSYLAMTRLTSAEIVLGKLASGLLQYAAWSATGLPIVILLPFFGGVDPRSVLLATAGTVSTAYFIAGLSIVVLTAAPRARQAVGESIGLAMVWVVVPTMVQLIVPISFPRVWTWTKPINDWVLASSPSSLLVVLCGWPFGPPWRLLDTAIWMVGLQLAGGSLLVAWAVVRFRKACRRHEENSGTAESLERPHAWLRAAIYRIMPGRRAPCWDSPMLWKELCTARRRTLAEKVSVLVALGFVALLVRVMFPFAACVLSLSKCDMASIPMVQKSAEWSSTRSCVSSHHWSSSSLFWRPPESPPRV